ncbi:MAG: sugar phosphate nucleotidyltransferase [Kiritimatiellae bacterium]|nr:sugar phosphate nucleotidyltransferase [Kiritimatiellia bacterium]
MTKRFAVILAGGKGERFWPLSTAEHPKQFLSLVGEKTLLAQAVERLKGVVETSCIYVITSSDLAEVARRSAPELPPENIIGEPVGRDTAAAIALGAALVRRQDPQGVMAVLTADHIIGDLDLFRNTLRDAMELALSENLLLTIGVKPAFPSTGYGYIQVGEHLADASAGTVFDRAKRFVEKPDAATAQRYMEEGSYYWNSGMFIWSAESITRAFQTFRPSLYEMICTLNDTADRREFDQTFERMYEGLEKISIDYAIMEKAENVGMARGVFAWDDVGSWPALDNHFAHDDSGNVVIGDGVTLEASDNIIYSKDRLTAVIGLSDVMVVQAEGVTLVCPKNQAQQIKELVQQLQRNEQYARLT